VTDQNHPSSQNLSYISWYALTAPYRMQLATERLTTLQIYDLNNVPLVSGSSFIKWHLAHSMHAEHRGRTSKCPIANHRVDYSFSKLVPSVRISMDRNNNLSECPIEFEVIQEFPAAEKITLGYVKLNLSEFVEESETFGKDIISPPRKRHSSSSGGLANGAKAALTGKNEDIEDGIIRRYLMQDSKVNSTLKIGILMVQVDGERNFIAPILKTAPVFGGIAGIMAPEQAEDEPGCECLINLKPLVRIYEARLLTLVLQRCLA
jgi:hypothetical protein